MPPFAPDPAFDASSVAAGEWPLCHLRLQDDARFPWLILIPRVQGAVEIDDLDPADQARLTREAVAAGRLTRQLGERLGRPVDKLNVAALGNVTAQLHLHVVGRRRDDSLWPDPVWGRPGARPWPAEDRARLLETIGGFSPPE